LISRQQLLGGTSDGRRTNAFRKIYSRMFAETFEARMFTHWPLACSGLVCGEYSSGLNVNCSADL
jgi:hypothetical protein